MVKLYVGGKQVGTLEENPDVLRRLVEAGETVAFLSESGKELGAFQPRKEPLCPWEPDLTTEEINRRIAEPGGMPLTEFLQQMGLKAKSGSARVHR